MKRTGLKTIVRAIVTGGFLFLFGIIAFLSAQPDPHDQDGIHQKEEHRDNDRREQENHQDNDRHEQGEDRQEQGQQSMDNQQRRQIEHGELPNVWREHRARSWWAEHETWTERGGYDGYHIPNTRFHSMFGKNHRFSINSLSLEIFDGHPRFQYNGYWFSVLDPWPEYWEENWYEKDDVYIDHSNDGYYLYNPKHPKDRIAVSVLISLVR